MEFEMNLRKESELCVGGLRREEIHDLPVSKSNTCVFFLEDKQGRNKMNSYPYCKCTVVVVRGGHEPCVKFINQLNQTA
jgi:hypothetical protein